MAPNNVDVVVVVGVPPNKEVAGPVEGGGTPNKDETGEVVVGGVPPNKEVTVPALGGGPPNRDVTGAEMVLGVPPNKEVAVPEEGGGPPNREDFVVEETGAPNKPDGVGPPNKDAVVEDVAGAPNTGVAVDTGAPKSNPEFGSLEVVIGSTTVSPNTGVLGLVPALLTTEESPDPPNNWETTTVCAGGLLAG